MEKSCTINFLFNLHLNCFSGDVGRSQFAGSKKEIDELKTKLQDYEKMSRFQKAAVSDNNASAELETKLSDAKKQLSNIERDHRSELNNVKMKFDGKIAVMNEEIASLKTQSSKYRRYSKKHKYLKGALNPTKTDVCYVAFSSGSD